MSHDRHIDERNLLTPQNCPVGSIKFYSSPSAGPRWTRGLSGELKPTLSLSDPLTVVLQKQA